LEDGVLVYSPDKLHKQADFAMTIPKSSLVQIMVGMTTIDKEVAAGNAQVTGDQSKFNDLLGLLEKFSPNFNIVTPNKMS